MLFILTTIQTKKEDESKQINETINYFAWTDPLNYNLKIRFVFYYPNATVFSLGFACGYHTNKPSSEVLWI